MVFSRYEKKYLMNISQHDRFLERIGPYMHEDMYGLSKICNIYYDTADSHLIVRSMDHPVYKEKLRLRSYGIPDIDSPVFLEIKKKVKGLVNKSRITLPLYEAYAFADHHRLPSVQNQIVNEIDYFLDRYRLKRGLYLAYDRIAYASQIEPEFRLTIDRNIRYRTEDMALEKGDRGTMLLEEDQYLLETKINGSTPYWFVSILSDLEIRPVSFSKYGRIYQKIHASDIRESIQDERIPAEGGNHVQQRVSCGYI